ncbi:MAG: hypothetical protein IJ004_01220 [Clostridia bacterium]|nr:hypothetical protein [Clostridia bacterium]
MDNNQLSSSAKYVNGRFAELDESIEQLKKTITSEVDDLSRMVSWEKKQADVYRNKVQAIDVLEAILPVITDIKNDAEDAQDLEELKRAIGIYIRSMSAHLKNIGVELKMHKENEILDPTEKVGGACRVTNDKELDGKIARTTQIGCIIHNEDPEEIMENVLVYKYVSELEEEKDEEPIIKLYDDEVRLGEVNDEPQNEVSSDEPQNEEKPQSDEPQAETPSDESGNEPQEQPQKEEEPQKEPQETPNATLNESDEFVLAERLVLYCSNTNERKNPLQIRGVFPMRRIYGYRIPSNTYYRLEYGDKVLLQDYAGRFDKSLRFVVNMIDNEPYLMVKTNDNAVIAKIRIIL